jgi:tyrosyl-tRNA synthetase
MVHGAEVAETAKAVSEVLFGGKDVSSLDQDKLEMLQKEAPSCVVQEGESILSVLVRSGLASSKREARQLLSDKGVSLGSETVQDLERTLAAGDFQNNIALLRRGGRKVSVLVRA